MLHYRIAFSPDIFYHVMASSNVQNIPAPNGMASIFMQSDAAPKRNSPHLLVEGNGAGEVMAMNRMVQELTALVGRPPVSVIHF